MSIQNDLCDVTTAISEYGKAIFSVIAEKIIWRLRHEPATGIHGDDLKGIQTLWDEFCYQRQNAVDGGYMVGGNHTDFGDAWEKTLTDIYRAVITKYSNEERQLLYLATERYAEISDDFELQTNSGNLVIDDAAIRRDVFSLLYDRADHREMSDV